MANVTTHYPLPTTHCLLLTAHCFMNVAIIPAAGSGSRFGGQTPKQFIEIAGAPIIVHTLRKFDECEEIGAIVVALRQEEVERFERALCAHKIRKPVRLAAVSAQARKIGAAILALPATDTIKEVEDGLIRRTLDRRRIWRAQTPQAFRYDLLMRANEEARAADLPPALATDDSFLVERLGVPVAVVEGMANNIKITTPEDLILAERLLGA